MDVAVVANLQVQAMVLGNARDYLDQAQQVPASAPQAQQAGVILSLSAAAQSLLT